VLVGLTSALAGCNGDEKVTATPVPAAIRQLVIRPLFGGMPLDNRVLDPEFALIDGQAWVPYPQ
jgi:hypothetical protein